MTAERLAQIRKATAINPRAFDDKGRPVIQAGAIRDIGCVAIQHRRELLELVDATAGENAQLRNATSVRLLAALKLLAWAVDFVEGEVKCLEESYRGPNGVIHDEIDEHVADEVADARHWLKEAQELLA